MVTTKNVECLVYTAQYAPLDELTGGGTNSTPLVIEGSEVYITRYICTNQEDVATSEAPEVARKSSEPAMISIRLHGYDLHEGPAGLSTDWPHMICDVYNKGSLLATRHCSIPSTQFIDLNQNWPVRINLSPKVLNNYEALCNQYSQLYSRFSRLRPPHTLRHPELEVRVRRGFIYKLCDPPASGSGNQPEVEHVSLKELQRESRGSSCEKNLEPTEQLSLKESLQASAKASIEKEAESESGSSTNKTKGKLEPDLRSERYGRLNTDSLGRQCIPIHEHADGITGLIGDDWKIDYNPDDLCTPYASFKFLCRTRAKLDPSPTYPRPTATPYVQPKFEPSSSSSSSSSSLSTSQTDFVNKLTSFGQPTSTDSIPRPTFGGLGGIFSPRPATFGFNSLFGSSSNSRFFPAKLNIEPATKHTLGLPSTPLPWLAAPRPPPPVLPKIQPAATTSIAKSHSPEVVVVQEVMNTNNKGKRKCSPEDPEDPEVQEISKKTWKRSCGDRISNSKLRAELGKLQRDVQKVFELLKDRAERENISTSTSTANANANDIDSHRSPSRKPPMANSPTHTHHPRPRNSKSRTPDLEDGGERGTMIQRGRPRSGESSLVSRPRSSSRSGSTDSSVTIDHEFGQNEGRDRGHDCCMPTVRAGRGIDVEMDVDGGTESEDLESGNGDGDCVGEEGGRALKVKDKGKGKERAREEEVEGEEVE